MFLFTLIVFYIMNITFIIHSQNCKNFVNKEISSCNRDNNYYYDTMICNCSTSQCNSRLINDNNCYSEENMVSLYGGNFIGTNSVESCTENEGYLTELDDQGNWLGYLMCANTIISFDRQSDYNNGDTNYFHLYTSETQQYSEISPNNEGNDNFNYDYYYYSCIEGFYDKSCQYMANLCVLAMYSENNRFCSVIFNLLDQNLRDRGYNNLLSFSRSTSEVLDEKISIETSFDREDNNIHINIMDLYLAK